jgi:hypothetical protein
MDTCKAHRFPSSGTGMHRSRGATSMIQCNNCLAVKVTQVLCVPSGDGGWTDVTKVTVVNEPSADGLNADLVKRFCPDGKEAV